MTARTCGIGALIVACSIASSSAAQTSKPQTAKPQTSKQTSDKKAPKSKVISLSGCVVPDETAPGQFVITDPKAGGTYRLSGKDFREYLGRPVTLDGGVVVKGFVVKGGLTPNPNIAAQAGAIDPSRAAVQAQTAQSATGPDNALPEFRVKAVRNAAGACPP